MDAPFSVDALIGLNFVYIMFYSLLLVGLHRSAFSFGFFMLFVIFAVDTGLLSNEFR